ncbi:MAG: cell division protein SepF [Pseudonocardiales bacterium]|nr:cell division protein SepF [Pseudonocardiales bacterium]
MSAMYRLKAYFGMVPAEELADYADEPVEDYSGRYGAEPPARHPGRRGRDHGEWDDRFTYPEDEVPAPVERPRVSDEWERRTAGRAESLRGVAPGSGLGSGAVRGALAMDPDAVLRDPVRGPRAVPSELSSPLPPAVPEQRERPAPGPVRITTLQPASYKEARTIGEHYRDGQPVIMNLTELDAADAKRLVDFAAGLAFALRGSIDKVTSRVFLLTPADVEVSADDARKLAQRSVFRQD